ncbi:MAG: hypothetical protein ABF976_06095 [Acetobacter syzygii]|uniref:hypothetical protein n=1 Tax=Acetobacter syzygii TaxID=146476 RepID=UPI00242F6A27|nr:hypothetical protein [Acetobacter syzygii]
MSNTNQNPALTCVISEHQLISAVRRYLSRQKTLTWATGLTSISFWAAEMA